MANRLSGPARRSHQRARLAYLRTHPDLHRLPSIREEVTREQAQLLEAIEQQMRDVGLIARTTTTSDAMRTIRLLVYEARSPRAPTE
jgi:hypothetical protein